MPLAEANDPTEDSGDATGDAALLGEAAAVSAIAAAKRFDSRPEENLLSKVGRERIVSFGCPHCGGGTVHRWGKANGKARYRCTNCRKTFNPLTGTPLAGLHYRDRWRDQVRALINGETISKAADRCKIDYTTAFRWRHRFLSALNLDKPQHRSGMVESDETFILEAFKGKRSELPRAARKRGGKASTRGLSVE